VGGDLGSAIKSFRKSMNADGTDADAPREPKQLTREEQQEKQ
jgi:Sec-independent protein translocase protein TatA